jgi:hypothetical protein
MLSSRGPSFRQLRPPKPRIEGLLFQLEHLENDVLVHEILNLSLPARAVIETSHTLLPSMKL